MKIYIATIMLCVSFLIPAITSAVTYTQSVSVYANLGPLVRTCVGTFDVPAVVAPNTAFVVAGQVVTPTNPGVGTQGVGIFGQTSGSINDYDLTGYYSGLNGRSFSPISSSNVQQHTFTSGIRCLKKVATPTEPAEYEVDSSTHTVRVGGVCSDDIDNDNDGLTDIADPRCHTNCFIVVSNPQMSYNPSFGSENSPTCAAPTLQLNGRAAMNLLNVFATPVVAQEAGNTLLQNKKIIADVSFYGGAVEVTQGVIKAGFTLGTELGSQNGVRYGIFLKKEGSDVIEDYFTSEDTLTIGQGKNIYKELMYAPIQTLSGAYEVYVQAETVSGISLATYRLGLYVSNSESKNKNTLSCATSKNVQEVTCTIQGQSGEIVLINGSLRAGGRLGSIVSQVTQKNIILNAKGRAETTMLFPGQELLPGTYTIDMQSVDKNNIVLAKNRLSAQVEGVSTKIDNVFVQQDSLQAYIVSIVSLGENSEVLQVITRLKQSNNVLEESTQLLTAPRTDVSLICTKRCIPDAVEVIIKDAKGMVLDTKQISYTPIIIEKEESSSVPYKQVSILLFLGVLVFGGVLFLLRKKTSAVA